MKVAAVIMAGGRGERFWPHSREDWPKQFLSFNGKESLLQRTAWRLEGLCGPDSLWISTRADLASAVHEQLPQVPRHQIFQEPLGRDTAPCIALAAIGVGRTDPDAVMIVLPADHLILQEARFREVLGTAVQVASDTDCLITLGVRPTRPETGYGYIQVGPAYQAVPEAFRVERFTEKPPREQALSFFRSGDYLWNSGIFIWKVSAIRQALAQQLPHLMEALAPLETLSGDEATTFVERVYPSLPKISIDYGVMERATNRLVIPADFGWDDLGTWTALERVTPADSDGNVLAGRTVAIDTKGSILQAHCDRRVLVTFGVSDLVVVDTEDAVLVAAKDRVADLKAVVGRLEAEGLSGHLRLSRHNDEDVADRT